MLNLKENNENNEEKIISFPGNDDISDHSDTEKENSSFTDKIKQFSVKRLFFYGALILCLGLIIYLVARDTSFEATNTVNETPIILSDANNFYLEKYREGFILAKDGKISCFNTNHELQWEYSGSKTAPTVVTNDKYCLVYYNEDKKAVITNGNDCFTIKSTGNVMYGNINSNGYSVLFAEETGLNNKIVVYDDDGEQIYLRQNADRFIPYACVSDNNYSLITLEISQSDSGLTTEICVVDITESQNNKTIISLGNNTINGIFMYDDDEFAVIKENSIEAYDIDGKRQWSTSINQQIYKYAYNGDDIFAVILNEDDSATSGSQIKFFETDGSEISVYKTEKKIYNIDICDKTAVLNADRELIAINTKGKFISSKKLLYDIKDALFINNKKCSLVLTNSEEMKLIPID